MKVNSTRAASHRHGKAHKQLTQDPWPLRIVSMSIYKDALFKACEIAEEASQLAASYFRQTILIEMKENGTPVTIADKKAEELIRKRLGQSFSDHGILGEEFGSEVKSSEYVWTIDPIDGTRSFIRGIPLFGTLLGLLHKGVPVVGVMVLPGLNETYVASHGGGAYCNGHQLRVSPMQHLDKAVISVGDVLTFEPSGKTGFLRALEKKADFCRSYTDCFGHSLLMRGSVDAMIDPVVSIWDIAPLACLIEEAGGDYCDFNGVKDITSSSFMSFTPALKSQLIALSQ
jgi:myo-inositol-1(or 4)-monophosphatase